MGLKDDLDAEVKKIFRTQWSERDGTVVPTESSLTLGNDAIKLSATVLYADMADSTDLVDGYKPWFAAEIYKTFLHCAAKIIRDEGGAITAYDGDRIMAVYLGGSKNTSAVRTAMRIKWASEEIITPAKKAQYPTNEYILKQVVGIDTSNLFVTRTGVRGANDLVWVGRAANYAAKLTNLPASHTYITKEIYDNMADNVKYVNGTNMWEAVKWNTFDSRIIYRSTYRWAV